MQTLEVVQLNGPTAVPKPRPVAVRIAYAQQIPPQVYSGTKPLRRPGTPRWSTIRLSGRMRDVSAMLHQLALSHEDAF